MKEETLIELNKLVSIAPKPLNVEIVGSLFDIYSTFEICSVEDLFRDHSAFQEFFKSIEGLFLEEDVKSARLSAYRRIYAMKILSRKSQLSHRGYHENFAKIVKRLVGFDKDINIMEVGSGLIPYSSMLLGVDGFNVTSIDNIYLSQKCLMDNFNVKSYREFFHNRTNISGMDVVVGRKPCSAIRPIVEKCSKKKTPYFVRLCGCDTPNNSVRDWFDILKNIDPDINFARAYAYNLNNKTFEGVTDIPSFIDLDEDYSMC